jgi:hypothetical protein
MTMRPVWTYCFTCRDYADKRREVIAKPLSEKAQREGRDVVNVVDEFMNAAHSRHMTHNIPLLPSGPTGIVDPSLRRLATMLTSGVIGHDQFNDVVGGSA